MPYDNTNRGVLFNNSDRKQKETQPDYKGSLNIEGTEYELAGWIKTGKESGTKFLSLSAKVKTARDSQ